MRNYNNIPIEKIEETFMLINTCIESEGLSYPEAMVIVGLLMLTDEQRSVAFEFSKRFYIKDGFLIKKS